MRKEAVLANRWAIPTFVWGTKKNDEYLSQDRIVGVPAEIRTSYLLCQLNIGMCIPIARQRVGKHIPAAHAKATIEGCLLGDGAVNTLFNNKKTIFSVGSTSRLYNEDLTRLEILVEGD
jgi:hypothetical protein